MTTAISAASRRWLDALGWAVGLSIFFFFVYGGCSEITARRSDVGQAAFGWERYLPFVPAMILPYMSIDLFFFLAPFLCRDRAELRAHTMRVLLAITIAGACFLLFPLHAANHRPDVEGIFAPIFRFFWALDRPYNLAPSLHIALRSLLWVIFIRHTRGVLRAALKFWFVLVGLSTLLTFQHQVIDVLLGYALAVFCFGIVPDESVEPQIGITSKRIDLALRYGAGSAICLAVGILLRPWGVLMVWPTLMLAALAVAYSGRGAGIFKKCDGRLRFATRVFLFPYLVGVRLMLWRYASRDTPWNAIAPGLLIGRRLDHAEVNALLEQRVTAVLDLSAELDETPALLRLDYRNLPLLDLAAPSLEQLAEACRFIDSHRGRDTVYVHCALGYSRSAFVGAAYLLHSKIAPDARDAMDRVKAARPAIVFPPRAFETLAEFAGRWIERERAADNPPGARVDPAPALALTSSPLCPE